MKTTMFFVLLKPEEPIHQRISELIQALEEGVQRRFAQAIGVASGVVGDILGQRKSKPGFEIISKILQAYPQLRAEWLMRGEGEMLKSTESLRKILVPAAAPNSKLNSGGFRYRPAGATSLLTTSHTDVVAMQATSDDPTYTVINFEAATNYLSGYQSQEYYEHLDTVTIPRVLVGSSRPGIIFQIEGNSMTPRFQHRDWVVAELLSPDEWGEVRDFNCCIVVSTANGIQFKRVRNRLMTTLKSIQCNSDNRRYDSFDIESKNLLQLFRFVLHLSSDASNPNDDIYKKVDNLVDTTSELHTRYEQLAQQIAAMQGIAQPAHAPENAK